MRRTLALYFSKLAACACVATQKENTTPRMNGRRFTVISLLTRSIVTERILCFFRSQQRDVRRRTGPGDEMDPGSVLNTGQALRADNESKFDSLFLLRLHAL